LTALFDFHYHLEGDEYKQILSYSSIWPNFTKAAFVHLRTVQHVTSDAPSHLSRKTLRRIFPACRHADRTLSSSKEAPLKSGVKSLRIPGLRQAFPAD
jgi:hypothetical protein